MLYRVEVIGSSGSIYFEDYIDDNSDNVDFSEKFVEFCKKLHEVVKNDTHHFPCEKEKCEIEVVRFKRVKEDSK